MEAPKTLRIPISRTRVEQDNITSTQSPMQEMKIASIAKRATIEKGIKEVVFDRGGFIYQGKIQALADAAREAGLKF